MASMVEYNLIDNFYGQFNFISTEKNEKSDSGNVLNLTVTKRTDNGDVVIGKKSFSWPDSSTAEVITYDSDNDILKMESSSYVAELSLKLPKSCIIVGKRDKEPVKIFKGFGNKSIDTSSTPLIVNKLKEILNNEKIVNWNELNEISKTFIKTSTLLIDPFTTMEQDLLVDLILNNHKESSLLLEALLHGKFFSMNSSSKLLEKLIEINDLQTLELLINDGSFPITDIIFTKLLKCAIDSKTDKGFNFFKKLLNRGFGSNMLTLEIEKQLSVKDALKLLEWLICMPLKENKDDSFGNLVEFASILLDSHFHKFVWDDTCHDLLRRFYLWTQSWITLAESFTSFSESTEVMKALSVQMEDLLNYNSGYTISKVTLSCTPLY
ncbi:Hypothetical protein SRAE_1000001100 [Strongyloides ratti]|uniref:Uncharacterized protein n=1 Tax=Strongyloides ratti TaxID=34506 RepID=A0A090L2R0_STRRB|nr:Hypothetical protein SRAE_1000001100 [Strongyloides ratti]CEF61734.1 Hypothetical protein SRAE_1000001100 [Strongyloides ratti]